jgi:hypothetical protein
MGIRCTGVAALTSLEVVPCQGAYPGPESSARRLETLERTVRTSYEGPCGAVPELSRASLEVEGSLSDLVEESPPGSTAEHEHSAVGIL